jgi:hypothetical protein
VGREYKDVLIQTLSKAGANRVGTETKKISEARTGIKICLTQVKSGAVLATD